MNNTQEKENTGDYLKMYNDPNNIVDAYVDGSFRNGKTSYAFVIIKNDEIIHKHYGVIHDKEINGGHQVGGEIQAVISAVKWCHDNKLKVCVAHDYSGLYKWVCDLFNGGKAWKANKSYTVNYREFIEEYRHTIISFKKVAAHTGNKWNEYVDGLAKSAYNSNTHNH